MDFMPNVWRLVCSAYLCRRGIFSLFASNLIALKGHENCSAISGTSHPICEPQRKVSWTTAFGQWTVWVAVAYWSVRSNIVLYLGSSFSSSSFVSLSFAMILFCAKFSWTSTPAQFCQDTKFSDIATWNLLHVPGTGFALFLHFSVLSWQNQQLFLLPFYIPWRDEGL